MFYLCIHVFKAARHKLVPGKVKENDFWRCYFWKCDIIIQSYLKMCVADKGKIADRYLVCV